MCILSSSINSIDTTKIFARKFVDQKGNDRQWIVYSMNLDTDNDVAMILPIPIKPGVDEDDIQFEDLSGCPDFFKRINNLFPQMRGMTKGARSFSLDAKLLKVHSVGAFEASFSPSIDDMDRLDPKFKLPKQIWSELPEYKDWGFVVFKLAKGAAERHPMSFSFSSRFTNKLFFPTVHVHHGKVPMMEEFDHVLFAQGIGNQLEWEVSERIVDSDLKKKSKALAELPVYKMTLSGELSNEDIYAKE